ncbi:hypothetical protein VH79_20920 [Salmonella enterica]|uniref:Uncharacterized protein n=1 Tax=Salmonella enterica TaxID=28901 RepID=A0A5U3IUL0_SALER|nr:hypothetical protein [Salmonella enterica]EEH4116106.1 hypothetical protein [Salmonella enterica subsp. enterica serovar Hvittingfoss]
MGDYGVRIYHADGTHFDFSERSTLCRVLGGGSVDYVDRGSVRLDYVENFNTGIHVPEGYDWWLWQSVSTQAQIGRFLHLLNWGLWGFSDTAAYLDDNRNINIRLTLTDTTSGTGMVYVDGYGKDLVGKWLKIPPISYGAIAWPVARNRTYGFSIYGADNMSGVFDTSLVSYLQWKGEVDIYNGWTPGNINPALNMNNCLCFFYTTDPGLVIGMDYDHKYRVWMNGRRQESPVRVKVCVFGNGGLIPSMAEYGLEVWNPDTGQRVYNSGRDVLLRPHLASLAGSVELSGNVLKRSPVRIPGIRRPMYATTNTGSGAADGLSFTDDGRSMSVFYTWVSSDGYSLYSSCGGQYMPYDWISQTGYFFYDRAIYQAGHNAVMVIDAEDYFIF